MPLRRLYTLGIEFHIGRAHSASLLPEVAALVASGRLRPGARHDQRRRLGRGAGAVPRPDGEARRHPTPRRLTMTLLEYAVADRVATITMDDGKANALSPAMLAALGRRPRPRREGRRRRRGARRPSRPVLGRVRPRCARAPADPRPRACSERGFELAERLLGFPRPVVIACTGHAVAMGSFLLSPATTASGPAGDFKIQANEVAIGLTMPYSAVAHPPLPAHARRRSTAPSDWPRCSARPTPSPPAGSTRSSSPRPSCRPRRRSRRPLPGSTPTPTPARSCGPGPRARRGPPRHRIGRRRCSVVGAAPAAA